MALKNDHYTYRVTWSVADNEYVGLCAEFPSLSWLAKTGRRFKGYSQSCCRGNRSMRKTGKTIPAPIANRHYSGKYVVRDPPETHKRP